MKAYLIDNKATTSKDTFKTIIKDEYELMFHKVFDIEIDFNKCSITFSYFLAYDDTEKESYKAEFQTIEII